MTFCKIRFFIGLIVVDKKTFRYSIFFLQPLMQPFRIPEFIFRKRYNLLKKLKYKGSGTYENIFGIYS
jgi:hypothetical protein